MKKKRYVAPSFKVRCVHPTTILAGSGASTEGYGTSDGTGGWESPTGTESYGQTTFDW